MIRLLYIIIGLGALSLWSGLLHAQHAYFPLKGRITFEKEVYVRARLREMSNRSANQNRGMMMRFGGNIDEAPEKTSSMFSLHFDEDETLMTAIESEETTGSSRIGMSPGRGGRPNSRNMGNTVRRGVGRNQNKTYYQNLKKGETELELELDEKYLLRDSLQQITWRFTDEYRDIAGYECRRVNGATPDSLYIVAFYTDQIPVSGGPALVHGLPGMILGLAIPEMHINYWARKVDFVTDNVPSAWRDKKSKAISTQDFFNSLGNNRMFGGGGGNARQMRRNLLENLIY